MKALPPEAGIPPHLEEELLDRGGRSVRREILIRAPQTVVYEALTRPAFLERWFPTEARFEAHRGSAWEFAWATETEPARGRVEEAQPPRRLSFTWESPRLRTPTLVSVLLEARGDRTHLVLRHSGFGTGAEADAELRRHELGWTEALWRLAAFLEEGRVQRTVVESVVVRARAENVWHAISSARGLNAWWTDTSRIEARPGGEFRLVWEGLGEAFGHVTAADPQGRLRFHDQASASTFLFRVEPEGAETRITLAHTSFAREEDWVEGTERFWRDTLRILKEYVEKLAEAPSRSR